MTNDEGMTKLEARTARWTSFRHSIVRHHFVTQHSCFDIALTCARSHYRQDQSVIPSEVEESLTILRSHMGNHIIPELTAFDFSRAFHETCEIVRDTFARDRAA